MRRDSLALCLLPGLLAAGCVEKDPDSPVKGPRPLSHTEKLRVKKHVLKAPPSVLRFPVNGNLDGKIVYLGLHTPEETVVPGKPFHVFHYFQVKQAIPGWKLFVHTNGPGLSDFRNFDHVPVFGLHPVTSWKAGEIVEDRHTILLPKEASYRTVDLYVGIWQGGKRLKVLSGSQDGANRLLAARLPVGPQSAAPREPAQSLPEQVVRRATGKIVIDGKAEEEDWNKAPPSVPFRDSLKGTGKPRLAEAKLLWDDEFLYVFFRAEDDDVWATVTQNDDPKLWTEQAFEVFLQVGGDGYIELQVNPRGALFDAYLPRPGQTQADWQSGAQAKVQVDGTLDVRTDRDKGWQVEMAIPWAAAKGRGSAPFTVPPALGTRLRANFFRTDRPKDGALEAWAWSPPMRPTFHALERFGTLVLGDATGNIAKDGAPRPAATESGGASPAPAPAPAPATPAIEPAAPATRTPVPAAVPRPPAADPRSLAAMPAAAPAAMPAATPAAMPAAAPAAMPAATPAAMPAAMPAAFPNDMAATGGAR